MKRAFLIVLLFCMLPVPAFSHPGKTNHHGGHTCFRGCEEWGLYYEEYHLHDKDGKPIRVVKKKKGAPPDESVLISTVTDTVAQEAIATGTTKTVIVTNYRYISNVHEENMFLSNPLIYILLILLLLLLILRMNRKRESQ